MANTDGMNPGSLLAPVTQDKNKLTLNDGSWYNLQTKYQNLGLLPDLQTQEVADVSTAFGNLRAHAQRFDRFMESNILGLANAYKIFSDDLRGDVDTIKNISLSTGQNDIYRAAANDAIDSIVSECQNIMALIDASKSVLSGLADAAGNQQTIIGSLSSEYVAKLGAISKQVQDDTDDLANQWKKVFEAHAALSEAFTSGLIDTSLFVVYIGQAAGEIATEETVSAETVEDIVKSGIDMIKDGVKFIESIKAGDEALDQVHTIYPRLSKELGMQYYENRAVLLLQYVELNFEEIAKIYQAGAANLDAEKKNWQGISEAWSNWKANMPATTADAMSYVLDSNVDAISNDWMQFSDMASSFAQVGNIVFTKKK